MCCSVLQCVAVCCSVLQRDRMYMCNCVMCVLCISLSCVMMALYSPFVAVRCSVLWCAMCCNVLKIFVCECYVCIVYFCVICGVCTV